MVAKSKDLEDRCMCLNLSSPPGGPNDGTSEADRRLRKAWGRKLLTASGRGGDI